MNNMTIYGRLGRDAEVKKVNDKTVTELRIAQCKKSKKDEASIENDTTMWFAVSLWGDRYEKLAKWLTKGSAVIVQGELSFPRIYKGKTDEWNVALEMTGTDVRFNPFGSGKTEEQQQQAKQSSDDIGDLF